MAKILALDPGGTTGWASYDTDERTWATGTLGPTDHHRELASLLFETRWNVVIYERFQYQRRDLEKGVSLVLVSVEYIGVVKYVSQCKSFQLIEQTPSQGKCDAPSGGLWTSDKLRKLGLWSPVTHIRDATSHLLYYLVVTQGDRSFLEKLRPTSEQQTTPPE